MMASMEAEGAKQWQQVLVRDGGATFVYAVTTTGIYCRPECPSRRPARAHVQFFPNATAAAGAGFRACLRCSPDGPSAGQRLGEEVSGWARYLAAHLDRQVSLAELARVAGRSAFTVQRVFSRALGVSPRAYANALRAERFRRELQRCTRAPQAAGVTLPAGRITDAVYTAGFSAPSRASHGAPLGMAARSYRAQGRGEQIGYMVGSAPDPALGLLLVAATGRGTCAVLLGDSAEALVEELRSRFPAAAIEQDSRLQAHVGLVLQRLSGAAGCAELPLDMRATAFQTRVWAALAAIPRGETRTYAQLAEAIGQGKAVRAVARACAQNPLAVLVPCHRVVGSDGKLTGYRWGLDRKKRLLAWEQEQLAGDGTVPLEPQQAPKREKNQLS